MQHARGKCEGEGVPMKRKMCICSGFPCSLIFFDLFAFLCFSVHMKWWRNGRTSIRFSTRSGNQSDFSIWSENANHSTCAFHRISTSLFKKDLNMFSRWMMRQFHTRTHQRLSSVMAFTLATRGGTANAIRVIVSLQFLFIALVGCNTFSVPVCHRVPFRFQTTNMTFHTGEPCDPRLESFFILSGQPSLRGIHRVQNMKDT